jgi:hypothetical protein
MANSDGFTILDTTAIQNSLTVFDGVGCLLGTSAVLFRKTILLSSTSAKTEFAVDNPVIPGNVYTLQVTAINGGELDVSSDYAVLEIVSSTMPELVYSLIPVSTHPIVRVTNTGSDNDEVDIVITDCAYDVAYQASTSTWSSHWSVADEYKAYISHYAVALVELICNSQSGCADTEFAVVNVGDTYHTTIHDQILTSGTKYQIAVQPCLNDRCLNERRSDGFIVQHEVPEYGQVDATMSEIRDECNRIEVQWDHFQCAEPTSTVNALFYQWGIFEDTQGTMHVLPWQHSFSISVTMFQL